MTKNLMLSFLGLALAASACGDGGGGGFSSGVDSSKPLNKLSASESEKICKAGQEWVKTSLEPKLKEFGCKLDSAFASALSPDDASARAACKMAFDMCLKAPPSMDMQMSACSAAPSTCTATVGEVEACINEYPAAFDELNKAFPSCDMLTKASTTSAPKLTSLDQSPACKALQMKCPGYNSGLNINMMKM